ncbi:MAG: hypothetical protein SFY95_06290 [Planctomycetota bacterium]|nr:hypothetical protein [Planctomycetota bacterium]
MNALPAAFVGASRRWFADVVCVASAALLILSGAIKAMDLPSFARVIESQGLFTLPSAQTLASTVALAEIAVAAVAIASLVFDRRVLAARALGLFVGILCASVLILAINPPARPVPCGCALSSAPVESWWGLVGRNFGWLILLIGASLAAPVRPN